jgi:hypothetical protein
VNGAMSLVPAFSFVRQHEKRFGRPSAGKDRRAAPIRRRKAEAVERASLPPSQGLRRDR